MVQNIFRLLGDKFKRGKEYRQFPSFGIQMWATNKKVVIRNQNNDVYVTFPVDQILVESKDGVDQMRLQSSYKKLETCEDESNLSITIPIDGKTGQPLVQQMIVNYIGSNREKLHGLVSFILSASDRQSLSFSDWLDENFNGATIKAYKVAQSAFISNDHHLIVGTTYQSAIDADPEKKKLQQDCLDNMSSIVGIFEDRVTNGIRDMNRLGFDGFLRDVQYHFIPREQMRLRADLF